MIAARLPTPRFIRRPMVCCAALTSLAGCANLAQTQTVATQFSTAAHTVASTEDSFFHALKAADCNGQFYNAAATFAVGMNAALNISSDCKPTILTDQQIVLRTSALDAISAYADKIAAIAGGKNTALDTDAKTLAGEINTRLGGGKGIRAAAETAIIELANIALDDVRAGDIKDAAAKAESPLQTVVDTLKLENTAFASGIDSKIQGLEVNLETILRTEHGARAFFDAAQARSILQAANPFTGPASLGAAEQSAAKMANTLNNSLDSLTKANTALATVEPEGVAGAVAELAARAKDAQSVYAALNK